MSAHAWLSSIGGDIPDVLRKETAHGLQIFQQMGIQPRCYTFDASGAISIAHSDNPSRFVCVAYANGVQRLFVHFPDPGLHEAIYRPFLPASDPLCWALVECWMVDNFCYNQQQHYHQSILCQAQMQPVRPRSILFGVLTVPLAMRCRAFLSAARMGGDDE